jgi:hypothetical protein
MLRKSLFVAITAALVAMLTPTDAHAWGARHVGYTHVGPYGVQHYGATVAHGPNGVYSGSHAGAYGYGGASYHAGSAYGASYGGAYGGAYHYNTGYGGAYHYGAVQTGGYGYAGGVYRRW